MKHVNRAELTETHQSILDACTRVQNRMCAARERLMAEFNNDRDNPRYRRLQSRFFKAARKLQEIAFFNDVSAIQSETILIGTIGFMTVSNWAKRAFVLLTPSDKKELATARSWVINSLFGLLYQMPSVVYLKDSRDAITGRQGFEITTRSSVQELADLALWVEVKSGIPRYFKDFEMVDELSIFTEILSGQKPPRRKPAPGDSVRVDTIALKLYTDFKQCFLYCEPRPIATFYIFQISPYQED